MVSLSQASIDTIDDAIAIADLSTFNILQSNTAFRQWTRQAECGGSVLAAIEGAQEATLKSKLEAKRPYIFQVDAKPEGARPFPAEYTFRVVKIEGQDVLFVHGRNTSKVREKELMLNSFSKLIEDNNKKIRKEKQAVANLLDNMKQAVFAINERNVVVPPMSRHSVNVFATDISGKNIFETLYGAVPRDSELFSGIQTVLMTIFGGDELQWELIQDNLPNRVQYHPPPGENGAVQPERTLKISYSPIWSDEMTLERLMFVIEDVTEVERLEREVKNERETNAKNIQLIQELVEADRSMLEGFLRNATELLQKSHALTGQIEATPEGIHELFRHLHTLKGNARILKLSQVSSVTHRVENTVTDARGEWEKGVAPNNEVARTIMSGIEQIRRELGEYSRLAKRILGIDDEFLTAGISEVHRRTQELEQWLGAPGDLTKQADKTSATRLHQGSRIAHTLKGLIRTIGEEAHIESIASLEHALISVKNAGADATEDQWAKFEGAYGEFLRNTGKMVFGSALGRSLRIEREGVSEIVLALCQLERCADRLREDDKAAEREAVSIAHSAAARSASINLQYMEEYFGRLESLFGRRETDDSNPFLVGAKTGAVREILDRAWRFVAFLAAVDVRHAVDGPRRTELRQAWSNGTVGTGKSSDTLLDAFETTLLKAGLVQGEWLERLSAALEMDRKTAAEVVTGMAGEGWDVLSAEQLLRGAVSWGDVSTRLAEMYNEGNECAAAVAIALALGRKGDTVSRSAYLRNYDLVRILASYRKEGLEEDAAMPRTMPVIEVNFAELRRLTTPSIRPALREAVERLFDLPAGLAVSKFSGMVNDISRTLSKKIKFTIVGKDVPVHRDMMGPLQDALLHILRNAADHGIENEVDRMTTGKPAEGKIELRFARSDRGLNIVISDDGKGIDVDRVVQKAVRLGLVADDSAAKMSREQQLNLIFLPGLSTNDTVNQFSGRGVGMDVVNASLKKLGGEVRVMSELGHGTRITLDLPMTRVSEASTS